MTRYYLDTSVILPYYRNEANSLKIQSFLQGLEYTPSVSDLSKVKYASALSRWVRMGEHCEKEAEQIQQKFEQHLSQGLYHLHEVNKACYSLAERWLLQRSSSLRTLLDALHLAFACHLSMTLATCDKVLYQSALHFDTAVKMIN